MSWEPAHFLTAQAWSLEPVRVAGYIYRGLGLNMAIQGSPKGRRPPRWTLTHLGSGHYICWIDGHVATAFPIASQIAECGDWDWEGLRGYINRDPELPKRAAAIIKAHPRCSRGGGQQDEDRARQIAMARA